MAVPREEWFEDHYREWRRKRIDAIRDHYGAGWFRGRRVLELGCGHADIGAAFAELGAIVTGSDARREHVDEAQRRHPEIASWQVADLDSEWPFHPDFDLVLHLGVLYHLADPEQALRRLLASRGHIVLETEVADSSDPYFVARREESGYDQAFNSQGCRPSPAFVERVLIEAGRTFSRIVDDRCNAAFHCYDWEVRDTGEAPHGQRRLWFVEPVAAGAAGAGLDVRSLLALQARLRPMQDALELLDEEEALDDLDQRRTLLESAYGGSVTDEEGLALYHLITSAGLRSGLEIGTGFGYATAYAALALQHTGGELVSMDCYVERAAELELDELASEVTEVMQGIEQGLYPRGLAFADEQLGALDLDDVVTVSIGISPQSVPDALGGRTLDFVFLHGGTCGEQPTRDVEAVLPFLEERCAMVFAGNDGDEAVARAIVAAASALDSAPVVLPSRTRLTLVGRGLDQAAVAALGRLFLRAGRS